MSIVKTDSFRSKATWKSIGTCLFVSLYVFITGYLALSLQFSPPVNRQYEELANDFQGGSRSPASTGNVEVDQLLDQMVAGNYRQLNTVDSSYNMVVAEVPNNGWVVKTFKQSPETLDFYIREYNFVRREMNLIRGTDVIPEIIRLGPQQIAQPKNLPTEQDYVDLLSNFPRSIVDPALLEVQLAYEDVRDLLNIRWHSNTKIELTDVGSSLGVFRERIYVFPDSSKQNAIFDNKGRFLRNFDPIAANDFLGTMYEMDFSNPNGSVAKTFTNIRYARNSFVLYQSIVSRYRRATGGIVGGALNPGFQTAIRYLGFLLVDDLKKNFFNASIRTYPSGQVDVVIQGLLPNSTGFEFKGQELDSHSWVDRLYRLAGGKEVVLDVNASIAGRPISYDERAGLGQIPMSVSEWISIQNGNMLVMPDGLYERVTRSELEMNKHLTSQSLFGMSVTPAVGSSILGQNRSNIVGFNTALFPAIESTHNVLLRALSSHNLIATRYVGRGYNKFLRAQLLRAQAQLGELNLLTAAFRSPNAQVAFTENFENILVRDADGLLSDRAVSRGVNAKVIGHDGTEYTVTLFDGNINNLQLNKTNLDIHISSLETFSNFQSTNVMASAVATLGSFPELDALRFAYQDAYRAATSVQNSFSNIPSSSLRPLENSMPDSRREWDNLVRDFNSQNISGETVIDRAKQFARTLARELTAQGFQVQIDADSGDVRVVIKSAPGQLGNVVKNVTGRFGNELVVNVSYHLNQQISIGAYNPTDLSISLPPDTLLKIDPNDLSASDKTIWHEYRHMISNSRMLKGVDSPFHGSILGSTIKDYPNLALSEVESHFEDVSRGHQNLRKLFDDASVTAAQRQQAINDLSRDMAKAVAIAAEVEVMAARMLSNIGKVKIEPNTGVTVSRDASGKLVHSGYVAGTRFVLDSGFSTSIAVIASANHGDTAESLTLRLKDHLSLLVDRTRAVYASVELAQNNIRAQATQLGLATYSSVQEALDYHRNRVQLLFPNVLASTPANVVASHANLMEVTARLIRDAPVQTPNNSIFPQNTFIENPNPSVIYNQPLNTFQGTFGESIRVGSGFAAEAVIEALIAIGSSMNRIEACGGNGMCQRFELDLAARNSGQSIIGVALLDRSLSTGAPLFAGSISILVRNSMIAAGAGEVSSSILGTVARKLTPGPLMVFTIGVGMGALLNPIDRAQFISELRQVLSDRSKLLESAITVTSVFYENVGEACLSAASCVNSLLNNTAEVIAGTIDFFMPTKVNEFFSLTGFLNRKLEEVNRAFLADTSSMLAISVAMANASVQHGQSLSFKSMDWLGMNTNPSFHQGGSLVASELISKIPAQIDYSYGFNQTGHPNVLIWNDGVRSSVSSNYDIDISRARDIQANNVWHRTKSLASLPGNSTLPEQQNWRAIEMIPVADGIRIKLAVRESKVEDGFVSTTIVKTQIRGLYLDNTPWGQQSSASFLTVEVKVAPDGLGGATVARPVVGSTVTNGGRHFYSSPSNRIITPTGFGLGLKETNPQSAFSSTWIRDRLATAGAPADASSYLYATPRPSSPLVFTPPANSGLGLNANRVNWDAIGLGEVKSVDLPTATLIEGRFTLRMPFKMATMKSDGTFDIQWSDGVTTHISAAKSNQEGTVWYRQNSDGTVKMLQSEYVDATKLRISDLRFLDLKPPVTTSTSQASSTYYTPQLMSSALSPKGLQQATSLGTLIVPPTTRARSGFSGNLSGQTGGVIDSTNLASNLLNNININLDRNRGGTTGATPKVRPAIKYGVPLGQEIPR